jgi:hypothetical protein
MIDAIGRARRTAWYRNPSGCFSRDFWLQPFQGHARPKALAVNPGAEDDLVRFRDEVLLLQPSTAR